VGKQHKPALREDKARETIPGFFVLKTDIPIIAGMINVRTFDLNKVQA